MEKIPFIKYARWCCLSFLLFSLFMFSIRATTYPPGSHGGGSMVLYDGDIIWGRHYAIDIFFIPSTARVYVLDYDPEAPNTGYLEIVANNIVIDGTLDAIGAGYSGSGGEGYPNGNGKYGNLKPPSKGDGPGGGSSGKDGLYYPVKVDDLWVNNDPTTNTTLFMGSGGGGGINYNYRSPVDPAAQMKSDFLDLNEPDYKWENKFAIINSYILACGGQCGYPQQGRGGCGGGGTGGGKITLWTYQKLSVTGKILTQGTGGENGQNGEGGLCYSCECGTCLCFVCMFTCCGIGATGRGGSAYPFQAGKGGWGSPSGTIGGSGAGGGILLICLTKDGTSISGLIDARGGRDQLSNGGTIKVFYSGDLINAISNGWFLSPRVYFRDLNSNPLPIDSNIFATY